MFKVDIEDPAQGGASREEVNIRVPRNIREMECPIPYGEVGIIDLWIVGVIRGVKSFECGGAISFESKMIRSTSNATVAPVAFPGRYA
jgi:hypothetical protein